MIQMGTGSLMKNPCGSTFACLTAETKHLGSDLATPHSRLPFVGRSAVQGCGEDHTGRVATRDRMLTRRAYFYLDSLFDLIIR